MLTIVVAGLLSMSCGSKQDPCEAMQEAHDASFGDSCGSGDDCTAVPCACADGSTVSTSSCFNGSCTGALACLDVCDEVIECSDTSNSNASTGGMFECSVPNGADNPMVMCDSATQYCLGSWTGSANLTGPACTPLPSGCTDCDCLSDDAQAQFPTSNNCDSVVLCQGGSAGFSVMCQQ